MSSSRPKRKLAAISQLEVMASGMMWLFFGIAKLQTKRDNTFPVFELDTIMKNEWSDE